MNLFWNCFVLVSLNPDESPIKQAFPPAQIIYEAFRSVCAIFLCCTLLSSYSVSMIVALKQRMETKPSLWEGDFNCLLP